MDNDVKWALAADIAVGIGGVMFALGVLALLIIVATHL